jgi:chemotaxis protein MotB
MKRRLRKEDAPENNDRWLISYSDFLTLMFTFFAALYALSSVDKEKIGKFSKSLHQAFNIIELPVHESDDYQKKVTGELTGITSKVEGIKVKTDPRGVVMTLSNDTAFISGSADIRDGMLRPLEQLADVLNRNPGRIVIEGHTDNIALSGGRYKSNWELATARAAGVLYVFIKKGLDPNRIIIAGYGEYRPVSSNESPEGRARNRRVEIVFAPAKAK